jgi:hypothetical protein
MREFPRKILVSPGYGAGWSSWCNHGAQTGDCNDYREAAQFVAEYEPIIEFLDNGGDKKSKEFGKLVEDLQDILNKKYDVEFYAGGVDGLEVRVVNGPYKITEYDGYETVVEQNDSEYWFY